MIGDILSSYVLGLLTPLTAVCVLPLVPGFIAFLSSKAQSKQKIWFGLSMTAGIFVFMMLVGILFTLVLQKSITSFIEVVSPIAFTVLLLVGVWLIFGGKLPFNLKTPQLKTFENPIIESFVYGFFLGPIILPCNPAFIAVFFSQAITVMSFTAVTFTIASFAIGMGTPLILLSLMSASLGQKITSQIAKHAVTINRVAGVLLVLLAIYELYYLF